MNRLSEDRASIDRSNRSTPIAPELEWEDSPSNSHHEECDNITPHIRTLADVLAGFHKYARTLCYRSRARSFF